MNAIQLAYRASRRLWSYLADKYDHMATLLSFYLYGVKHSTFRTHGRPLFNVSTKARGITIGKDFAMNNGWRGNPIGQNERCLFAVSPGASITIGDNVGISQTALVAVADITIGNNVKIGGGTVVYTSDFHSVDAARRRSADDHAHQVNMPVTICDDAFIGARTIILKGVTIGERSVVGAGSVVTKSIPADEMWAGNPACKIKSLKTQQ